MLSLLHFIQPNFICIGWLYLPNLNQTNIIYTDCHITIIYQTMNLIYQALYLKDSHSRAAEVSTTVLKA